MKRLTDQTKVRKLARLLRSNPQKASVLFEDYLLQNGEGITAGIAEGCTKREEVPHPGFTPAGHPVLDVVDAKP